jgi:ribosomal protein S27E
MSVNVVNCKRCNRVFQRRLAETCADCIKEVDGMCARVYQALHKSASQGGISVQDLARQLKIPAEEIEALYMDARLGTAGTFLKTECQGCGLMIFENDRKGRYCLACSELTAIQAGVEVKSLQHIRAEEETRKALQEQAAQLVKAPLPVTARPSHLPESVAPRRYGFSASRPVDKN